MGCDTYVLKQFAIGRPNSNPMSIASGLMLGNPEIGVQRESGARAVVTAPFKRCGRGCNRTLNYILAAF